MVTKLDQVQADSDEPSLDLVGDATWPALNPIGPSICGLRLGLGILKAK